MNFFQQITVSPKPAFRAFWGPKISGAFPVRGGLRYVAMKFAQKIIDAKVPKRRGKGYVS